ncbi:MAG: methyltransferase domain-containing protein [Pseudomonadota bacterium]
MSNKTVSAFFDSKASETYDERNRKLSPINNNLHLLIRLILNDLPEEARILCVGVGTGSEIVSLAEAYPKWRFTGIDPSTSMLEACRDKSKNMA